MRRLRYGASRIHRKDRGSNGSMFHWLVANGRPCGGERSRCYVGRGAVHRTFPQTLYSKCAGSTSARGASTTLRSASTTSMICAATICVSTIFLLDTSRGPASATACGSKNEWQYHTTGASGVAGLERPTIHRGTTLALLGVTMACRCQHARVTRQMLAIRAL